MRYKDYKKEYCRKYFLKLAEELKGTHELVTSCNGDCSLYLIPIGTIDQLTYYGKPMDSYRFSDHWNWYANVNKCKNERHVQCHNIDLRRPAKRINSKATKPRYNVCVAYYGTDHKYHTLIGDKYDEISRKLKFVS